MWKMIFWKPEFCEKWDFENVNCVKNETLINVNFVKMRFWKCEYCGEMRLWKCEFCENRGFENVNFVKS